MHHYHRKWNQPLSTGLERDMDQTQRALTEAKKARTAPVALIVGHCIALNIIGKTVKMYSFPGAMVCDITSK